MYGYARKFCNTLGIEFCTACEDYVRAEAAEDYAEFA